jgi:hypothetical protein
MNLAGMMAILVGWMMIANSTQRRLRHLVTLAGTAILTLGMATIVQARF